MSAPLAMSPAEQDLLGLLGLVDVSRALATAAEEQYRADLAVLYAERLASVRAARATDADAELLSAAFLASLVLVVRRALTAGAEEGARFAQEQFLALDLPTALLPEVEVPIAEIGDRLVRDLLTGQVAVVKAAGPDLGGVFKELLRRAELAVVSAVQFGRGTATEAAFDAIAGVLGTELHKLWVARFDLDSPPCKLCVRLHGQHVALGHPFPVIKTEAAPYVLPLSGPPRHPNCRCSLVLYVPSPVSPKGDGLTPLTMQAYAEWALGMTAEDRSEYLAATIVRVKGYTRMVDGRLQHVSGYFYNIQTGQKVPAGQWGSVGAIKEVSAKQAKSMAKVSKKANIATPKGGALDLSWKPGTYKIDRPGSTEDTQVVVHQDGSSTSIHKGVTEDNDKGTTARYLATAKQLGMVQKISDDPEVADPDGPGPLLEPGDEDQARGTLPEGFYMLPGNSNWGGLQVKPDGSADLYKPDFKKKFTIQEVAVKQIAKGSLGEVEEVEQNEFNSDWDKEFKESRAGGAKAPRADASGSGSRAAGAGEPGDAPKAEATDAPDFKSIPDVNIPDEPPMPDPDNAASGLVVLEPDGSVWIYEPKDHFAGYEHTWPKGGHESDLTLQQNAHKELWEEIGITADVTGYLGDYKRSQEEGGKVRMYVATRKGGTPLPDDPTPYEEGGNETASVKKVSPDEAKNLLNVNRDKRILKDLVEFGQGGRAPAQPGSAANAPESAPSAPSQQSQGGSGSNSGPNAPEAAPSQPSQSVPNRPAPSQSVPDQAGTPSGPAIPEAPEGGPGEVIAGGPSLFSVGEHSVQIEEGSQVYRSSKSKDTLYVLQPDGDLIKYNPQGAGVQATKVGSSENPAARARQLSKLNNVTDEGVSIQDSMPAPGTGKALLGGFEMTSGQIDAALAVLMSNPSGNVAGDLKKAGSPLAAGKFHEVAAPYKAYYNNKTKPALIAALKKAQQKTGSTPASEVPAVAHLAESHGLEEHHASLGHSDTEAIHSALHAVDPQGSDHSHANDGPGFITVAGTPFPPATVAQAIDALKSSPSKETGVKKPLKAGGSPLANLDLQELANNSSVTESFKGSNGKVHYGKLKPAVIVLLTDALDKHQSRNPPTGLPAATPAPEQLKMVGGLLATQAEILEMQQFFDGIDMDMAGDPSDLLAQVGHNPLAYLDWDAFLGPDVPSHQMNQMLHDGLNNFLDTKTAFRAATSKPVEKPEDTSPEVKVGPATGTADQLKQYMNALNAQTGFSSLSSQLPDNPFAAIGPAYLGQHLGIVGVTDSVALKQAISDAIQKKIDNALFKEANPAPLAPTEAPSSISIGGKQVTKAELLAAVEAVQNSPSTGVKGPLKSIDSPLSKVDIKAYIEADPLSAPYKGSNGKVHYGKLKEAVAAVLQAKADEMGTADLPETPAVTPAGDASPEVDAPSVSTDPPGALDPPEDEPADDFFDDTPTTDSSGELTPKQKLDQAWQNAELAPDLNAPDKGFASAFQSAAQHGGTWYATEDSFSENSSDFEGSFFYEIGSNGTIYEVDEEDSYKKLSESKILSLLDGEFSSAPGLDADLADADLPEAGFYTGPGLSMKIYSDGSALITNINSGELSNMDSPQSVKTLLDSGAWTKVSDTPDEVAKAHVEGIEVGLYAVGGGQSVAVYPDGLVFLSTQQGEALMDIKSAKSYLQNQSVSPSALELDPPGWMKDALTGPGGFLQGEYDLGAGESIKVTGEGLSDEFGDSIHPNYLVALLFNNDATYKPWSAVFPMGTSPEDAGTQAEEPQQQDASASDSLRASLVEKAKAAMFQDSWASTTTSLSKGFQLAVKNNETMYGTGVSLGGLAGFSTGAPPAVNHYKFTPDGHVTFQTPDGVAIKTFSVEELVEKLDGVYDGPSVVSEPDVGDAPDVWGEPTPAPAGASEIHPDGVWNGYPVGTYTDGEGYFIDVTEDGPLIDFEDANNGVTSDDVEGSIAAGDLSFVPPLNAPVATTPNMPADAVKLSPVTVAGYASFSALDKPQALKAVKKWAEDVGLPNVVGQHLSTQTKAKIVSWLKHWSDGEWDKAYEIETEKVQNHKAKLTHPGSPSNPANASGFQKKVMAPYVDGELPAGTIPPGVWPSGSPIYNWDSEDIDAYMLAANMQNPTGLNSHYKKQWVYYHNSGNKFATDSMSFLAQKNVGEGDILSSPILPAVEKYLPGQAIPLPADFPEIDVSKSHASNLTNQQLDQYINHLGTKKVVDFLAKQKPETKQAVVALHAVSAASPDQTTFKDPALAKQQLTDILGKVSESSNWNEEETTSFIHDLTKVENKTFTMDADQPPLAGHSTLYHVSDEQGNPFLFKVAPEKFRAEIEHAAHELAQLTGLKVAASQLGTFNGKFGQFQAKIPSQSTLKGVAPTDLTLSALKDLLRAHVQDYVTSNDDAHDDNFLLSPDGKRVIPIDIARAFVRFGKPGAVTLKLGSLSGWEKPYYEKVYSAILSKKYSDADVDELYRASLTQAKKVAKVSDESWSGIMDQGLKNRTNYGLTSASSRQELIQQALARKNGLAEEFEQFWDGIYQQLGRDKPASSTAIANNVFSGFTPEHLAHAEVMGNHGAATFFGGADLEDGHMLAQVFNKSGGAEGKELHLFGQLRKDADTKLRNWLNSHLSADISGATLNPNSKKAEFLSNVDASDYASTVVAAAKTISHHHKQGDLNYNTSHMAKFEAMQQDLAKKISDADAGNFPSSLKDWPEAQAEYKSLLGFYDGQLKKVVELKDMGGQSKIGDYPEYDLTVPPSPVLDTPIEMDDGLKVVKISSYYDEANIGADGKFTLTGDVESIGQSGKTFRVELSDGTHIEYRSWSSTDNVKLSQQGSLRIKVRDYDGTTSGADAARTALMQMGVDLVDATEEDMELFYWRHLYGVMQDRKDGLTGKKKEVADAVSANLPGGVNGTPALSAKEELERWRAAWSRLDPAKFNTFLANRDWMPKFNRANPAAKDQRGGVPYWMRFDADMDQLRALPLVTHSLKNPELAPSIVKAGGLLSTEMRTQLLGEWKGGQSSTADQSYGSGNFIFTRLNGVATNYAQIYISPEVLARTSNYAYNADRYGDMTGQLASKKSNAWFDLSKATSHTSGSNETMIKRYVSLLDDIELIVFPNTFLRQEAIEYLKSHGVTTIRGLPIEDRLVLEHQRTQALAKINAHRLTWDPEEESA